MLRDNYNCLVKDEMFKRQSFLWPQLIFDRKQSRCPPQNKSRKRVYASHV
jgi:hypothetical protein